MTDKEKKKEVLAFINDAIEREKKTGWLMRIVRSVFQAEDELLQNPEWKNRLKYIPENDKPKVAEEYCRAVAEIIVDKLNKKKG